jgi:hypothetical protein
MPISKSATAIPWKCRKTVDVGERELAVGYALAAPMLDLRRVARQFFLYLLSFFLTLLEETPPLACARDNLN